MSTTDSAPAPLGDRFAVITDDDHTGVLWVVAILCLIYTIMIFFIRLEARRKNFGLDDVLSIIGTCFASIQYILIFVANQHGLGRSYTLTNNIDAEQIGKYILASRVLLLLALGLAKCSVISLCRRLFSAHMKSHRILCDIAMGLCVAWSLASILALSIDCSPLQVLGYETDFCHNLATRWLVIGILDCVTEAAIVGMAFEGLWPLQMSMSRKLQAFATFALRLIIIAFAVLHINSLQDTIKSTNVGVAYVMPTVYLQVELLYSLLSAAIPAMNRWLRNFDTSMGSAWLHNSQTYSLSNDKSATGRGGSHSIQLQSMDSQHGGTGRDKRTSRASMISRHNISKRVSAAGAGAGAGGMGLAPPMMTSADFVPPGPKYSASTEVFSHSSHSPDLQDRPTSTGMNSEDMIIRKDVQWNVQYEHEHDGSVHRGST